VIKTYVEVGLGIGIIAPMAFNSVKDTGLALLAADHLFEGNTTRPAVHRGVFLRDYARQFITMVAPGVDDQVLQRALAGGEWRRHGLMRFQDLEMEKASFCC